MVEIELLPEVERRPVSEPLRRHYAKAIRMINYRTLTSGS